MGFGLGGSNAENNHEGKKLMILHNGTTQKTTDQWARETEKEERKLLRKTVIGKYYRKGCGPVSYGRRDLWPIKTVRI
jgi:hypothetical protein